MDKNIPGHSYHRPMKSEDLPLEADTESMSVGLILGSGSEQHS